MSVVIPLVAADGTRSSVTLPSPTISGHMSFPLTFPSAFGQSTGAGGFPLVLPETLT